MTDEQREKLAKLKKETWIKNVIKVYGWTPERAESEWIRIHHPLYKVIASN